MNIPLVNLKRQYKGIKPDIKRAVGKIFSRGNFILGEEVEKFEKSFARYCGTKYAIGVASGADALLLILDALEVGQGDEVITVPNTFIATIFPIIRLGAKPILAETDKDTYQMDVNNLERLITKRTKVIIPVHLFGIPSPMDEILKIAKRYKLHVVEDACQAHGSSFRGKRCGSFGIANAFSFYPGKNLGAAGDGGGVTTNSKLIAEKIRAKRDIGQVKKYKHNLLGYNSRLDTIHAAVLGIKLKHLNSWNARRRKIASRYRKFLSDLPIILPPRMGKDYIVNYYLFVIRTKKRDKLLQFLRENGVFCGIHYPIPVHLQKSLKSLGYKKGDFPIAEKYAQEFLSLPMSPELKMQEVEEVSRLIHTFFKKKGNHYA